MADMNFITLVEMTTAELFASLLQNDENGQVTILLSRVGEPEGMTDSINYTYAFKDGSTLTIESIPFEGERYFTTKAVES
jgi:hypothetical protein